MHKHKHLCPPKLDCLFLMQLRALNPIFFCVLSHRSGLFTLLVQYNSYTRRFLHLQKLPESFWLTNPNELKPKHFLTASLLQEWLAAAFLQDVWQVWLRHLSMHNAAQQSVYLQGEMKTGEIRFNFFNILFYLNVKNTHIVRLLLLIKTLIVKTK